jgi:hypothetical protein
MINLYSPPPPPLFIQSKAMNEVYAERDRATPASAVQYIFSTIQFFFGEMRVDSTDRSFGVILLRQYTRRHDTRLFAHHGLMQTCTQ